MRHYLQALAVASIVVFFSGVDLYLFLAEYTTVTPRDWLLMLGILVAPVAIYRLHHHDLYLKQLGPIAFWCLAYLIISTGWYGFSPSDASLQELRDRVFAVSLLGLAAFVFITPDARKAAGIAVLLSVIATVVINVIELAQPDWFLVYVKTRSSGLYLNANSCGAALVCGMLVGAPLVPRRLRLSFYLLVGGGVAMTFSRSTIVGWLLATSIMLAFDSSRSRARELLVGCAAALLLAVVVVQGAAVSGVMSGLQLDNNLLNRVSFFRTFEATDDAAQQRKDVAVKAWGLFAARPLQGNGLASTREWSEPISTHNMFLLYLADHGVVGILILPALLMCVFPMRPPAAPGPHWAFCAFVVWYAFFSHGILVERYQLLAFAFFAMGGTVGADADRRQVAGAAAPVVRLPSNPFPSLVKLQ